jgi:hypothetical protein
MATRTWVSGVGDDANPGSRTAPCKTFAGAFSRTDPRGEIDALDPGGFGAVTITKAITIEGNGTFASILAAGTTAIIVNAGVNDVIVLRNLSINGQGTGLNGIDFRAGAALHIENCVIFGFGRRGIFFQPAGNSRLFVKDSIIRNNSDPTNGGGVFIQPGAAGAAHVTLDNVRLEQNLTGVFAADRTTLAARNCVVAGNTNAGFLTGAAAAPVVLNLEQCLVSENNVTTNTAGILSSGAQSTVRISNVMVVNNSFGLFSAGGGAIVSFGNNRIAGNATDGVPTATPGQK